MAKPIEWKSLITAFLMGGFLIAGVKFLATQMDNPALASILAGFPVGLTAIFFLTTQKSVPYAHNYFFVTLSLLTAIMVFYLLITHTKWNKNLVLVVAMATWATLVGARYLLFSRGEDG